MIALDVRDYCQNCPDFRPKTEKFRIGDKFMTNIRCVDYVKCEKIYNWISEEVEKGRRLVHFIDSNKCNLLADGNTFRVVYFWDFLTDEVRGVNNDKMEGEKKNG